MEFSLRNFRNPQGNANIVHSWPWNGQITRELIDRELDEMLEMGIRAVYPIPMPQDFRPTSLRSRMLPGYLSDEFFELTAYAAKAAKARGIDFWLYDEGGWPSGDAGHKVAALDPNIMRTAISCREIALPANVPYRQADEVIIAFCKDAPVHAGDCFPEDVTVCEYVRSILAFSGLVDIIDRHATELFIESTHEGYAKAMPDSIGTQVKYFFTDEPNNGRYPWPKGFAEDFQAAYGYDIRPYLPAILHPDEEASPEGIRARIDYHTFCGELFRRNYLDPLRDWCRAHGMQLCGHLNGEDTAVGAINDSQGSTLQSLRHMDFPGVDLIWRQLFSPDMLLHSEPSQIPFFPRVGSSAARQIGRKLSLSESFNIFGAGLTWEQERYISNYQLVRGINVMNGMNIPACRERATALNMRPCYTPEVPGMNHMRALNLTIARSQYLLQLGDPAGDTCLYTPDNDYLAGTKEMDAAAESFIRCGLALEDAGVDFDYIDDEAVRNAEFRDGALCIGSAVYRHAIIPDCRYMPEDVREKLSLLDNTPAPTVMTDTKGILARKYRTEHGSAIYFVYNQSAAAVNASLRFDEQLVPYELEPETGSIRRPAEKNGAYSVSLASGQAKIFLFTTAVLPCEKAQAPVKTWPLTDFEASRQRAYRIDDMGIRSDVFAPDYSPVALGGWAERYGSSFSGEVLYRTVFTPDIEVQSGDRYILSLGDVKYSARVLVNGQEVGIAAFAPWTIAFDALPGKLEIVIEVANTPANEITSTACFDHWPATEIAHNYHDKTLVFEKESLDGGLYGPVTLKLMR